MTSERIQVALEVARSASAVANSYFRNGVLEELRKSDGSVVTEADLRTEMHIRELLRRLDPGVGVLGEEFGEDPGVDGRWIVDPIDGTENFRRGSPFWGVLIAWCDQAGEVSAAAVSAPSLGREWWAVRGGGAFGDGGRRLAVSREQKPEQSSFCFGGAHEYTRAELSRLTGFAAGCRVAWGLGNFLGHMQVAEGIADAALSHGAAVWDLAAPSLIVAEAGGRWSDLEGRPDLGAGSMLSSNRHLASYFLSGLTAVELKAPTGDRSTAGRPSTAPLQPCL